MIYWNRSILEKYDQLEKCWWCESPNLKGEHKFNRTDLVSLYGKGPYKNENRIGLLKFNSNNNPVPIQSPNSGFFKFPKNLCKKCNNDRSSSFDLLP